MAAQQFLLNHFYGNSGGV